MVPEPQPTTTEALPAAPRAKPAHSTTELYFGGAVAAGATAVFSSSSEPASVRIAALAVAGCIAIAYHAFRHREKSRRAS